MRQGGQGVVGVPVRKRRRVFLWVFLAVQVVFLVWIIVGLADSGNVPDSCSGLTGDNLRTCEDAGDVGTALAVGLVVWFWVAADIILGFTYLIYRFTSRQSRGR